MRPSVAPPLPETSLPLLCGESLESFDLAFCWLFKHEHLGLQGMHMDSAERKMPSEEEGKFNQRG